VASLAAEIAHAREQTAAAVAAAREEAEALAAAEVDAAVATASTASAAERDAAVAASKAEAEAAAAELTTLRDRLAQAEGRQVELEAAASQFRIDSLNEQRQKRAQLRSEMEEEVDRMRANHRRREDELLAAVAAAEARASAVTAGAREDSAGLAAGAAPPLSDAPPSPAHFPPIGPLHLPGLGIGTARPTSPSSAAGAHSNCGSCSDTWRVSSPTGSLTSTGASDFTGDKSVSMSGVWARRHRARLESMLRRDGGSESEPRFVLDDSSMLCE
jgi:hypothetical protein